MYINFPSAVVKFEEIKALGIMMDRVPAPQAMRSPSGQAVMAVQEIPLLIAYTADGSINCGQVRDHETAIDVKEAFFALCQGDIDLDGFHEELANLARKLEAEEEDDSASPTFETSKV